MSAGALARVEDLAAVFQPADPPRAGRVAFWSSSGAALNGAALNGAAEELTVALPEPARRRAASLPVIEAAPLLLAAHRNEAAHPAARFWGAGAGFALRLVARGRILPGVSPGGHDAWRAGPLDGDDAVRLRVLAAAMPPEARAVPLPDSDRLPDATALLRAFLDAIADAAPRTPAASLAAGGPLFAAVAPQPALHLKPWAEEVAAGVDSGVRISLRLTLREADRPDQAALTAVVQVHSLADAALLADAAALWDDSAAAGRFGARARIDTMLAVRRAARAWPTLERLLHLPAPDRIELADDEVSDLLTRGAARLAAAGVQVHWPKQLVRDLTAKAVIREPAERDETPSFFGAEQLFGFDWKLALGDQVLTEDEMRQLAEAHRPLVRLRDQWIVADPALLAKARQRGAGALTAIDALGVALTGSAEIGGERVEVATSGRLETLRDRLTQEPKLAEQPAALRATLRAYQLKGLRWLDRMTSVGLGGCLADDMGLGKTITLIALHLHRSAVAPNSTAPTLVVCPASLLGNWEREIERFAPGTPVSRFHGPGRTLDGVDSGFVLTTYGTMRVDAQRLAKHRWDLVVADEAQHVKNSRSGAAKALRAIPANARVALTGTPVENNLSELWSILDWTTPGLLGTLGGFRARWAAPIEADGDTETAQRLARLVGPFLLRRRKSDPGIAPELPPKTETDQPAPLTAEQAGLYQAAVNETLAAIRGAAGMERRGLVMKLLTALKQICNHPAQYLGETAPRLAGRSGKLELLDELLATILAEDGAALVFTQYVAMARLLRQHLSEHGVPTELLHGGTPVATREKLVQRFQDGQAPVFLLSLKAAGTGLNLTRADHVIHYDRWWNPAVEEQATDRAYRIGQTRPVQVHRLIAEGTVEDRIAEMLAAKRELAEAVLGAGEAALTELTDAELAALVELRSTR